MIALQPFEKKDFDQLISWVTDEEILMQFAGPSFQFPLTADQLELSLNDKNRLSYKIIHMADNVVIGHAEIDLRSDGSALLRRIFIGNIAYRGKGLGKYITNQLLSIAFSKPGIEETFLNVFDWNIAAIKSYKKAGFRINEGKTLTRQIKGQTWIAINMRINKKTWNDLQKSV